MVFEGRWLVDGECILMAGSAGSDLGNSDRNWKVSDAGDASITACSTDVGARAERTMKAGGTRRKDPEKNARSPPGTRTLRPGRAVGLEASHCGF